MLQISAISGNISDKEFESLGDCERLRISRTDMQKNRLRRRTDRGTDVGLILEPGRHLHDGDVLVRDGRHIVIEQIPEKVMTAVPRSGDPETLVLLGHIIGNRHRPISIRDGSVSFPIQSDSERETFGLLFSQITGGVDLAIGEKVFRPHTGADVHEHG